MLILSDDDKREFTGQIIDIFEDFLEEKDAIIASNDCRDDGVIIAGKDYDEIRCKLSEMMENWGLFI